VVPAVRRYDPLFFERDWTLDQLGHVLTAIAEDESRQLYRAGAAMGGLKDVTLALPAFHEGTTLPVSRSVARDFLQANRLGLVTQAVLNGLPCKVSELRDLAA
jgi:hypothetical protein